VVDLDPGRLLASPLRTWEPHRDAPATSRVVQVVHADAQAYCAWAHKALPTEAEWELAARGGLEGAAFTWGDEECPDGRRMANTWQGAFPWQNLVTNGFERTSPVGAFPPNGFGLHDMAGNVWEWTDDWYAPRHPQEPGKPCCTPVNPRGGTEERSIDPSMRHIPIPRKVLKGGSHLCAPNYCLRYRPAARSPQAVDTAMSHLGFRCVVRP
jgi:formylglycine-generating enzyme